MTSASLLYPTPYPAFRRVLALLLCTALSSVAYGGADDAMPVTRSQTGRVINTVVVPAYKENPNIRPLAERLFKALDEHGKSLAVSASTGRRPALLMHG